MNYKEEYEKKHKTLEECVALIKSGDYICCGGALAEPDDFIDGLYSIDTVNDVILFKGRDFIHPLLYDDRIKGHFLTLGHLYNDDLRKAQEKGLASYIPSDLHNFGEIRTAVRPNNVTVLQTTDMDENGNFMAPYSMMFEEEVFNCAKTVILQVNPQYKRVRGGLEIPIDRVAGFFISDKKPFTLPDFKPSDEDLKIGKIIADYIHDGDTIQLGIGKLPDAVAIGLREKTDLGLHTEMFTSNMVDLIRRGNITGKCKNIDKEEHVGGFAVGDEALYKTLSENPQCIIKPCRYTNDPLVIGRVDNFKSVNTCIEIDLTGQVCSESIGPVQFSGTGGACDFARGALRSKGGRSIIAFNSTAKKGTVSKIKPVLTPGAAVTIPRNCVDTVVTEFGAAELKGRSVAYRVKALIDIAHPDHRQELTDAAKELNYI